MDNPLAVARSNIVHNSRAGWMACGRMPGCLNVAATSFSQPGTKHLHALREQKVMEHCCIGPLFLADQSNAEHEDCKPRIRLAFCQPASQPARELASQAS